MLSVNSVVNRPDSKQFDLLCESLLEAEPGFVEQSDFKARLILGNVVEI